MTIPIERTRAVLNTRDFMFALLDPKQTPRVPRAVRQRANRCLRHYPWTGDLKLAADRCPESWGQPE
jgi:hypothetical protein